MAKGDTRSEKKANYFEKLYDCLRDYRRILLVNVDNVTSAQINTIRQQSRPSETHKPAVELTLLMGKNTMIRRAIRNQINQFPHMEKLLPYIRGNVGFVFTNGDLCTARDMILANKVSAPAKAGAIAPCAVTVPKGNTGMGPEKTNFFQALGISTKITKGTVEIVNDVVLFKEGDKVGQSEATLLNMLHISPFTYGLSLKVVYEDNDVYEPSLLDINSEHISACMQQTIERIASISLAVNRPTAASVPHIMANSIKKIMAVALESEHHTFAAKDKVLKAMEASKHAVHAPAAAAAPAGGKAAPAAKVEEPEEEEDEDMGFGLFD